MAVQAGGVAEGDGQVRLAEPDTGDEDGVGLLRDEAEAKEVLYLRAVDLLRPVPLELIKGLHMSVVALFDGAPSTLFEGIPSSRSDTL